MEAICSSETFLCIYIPGDCNLKPCALNMKETRFSKNWYLSTKLHGVTPGNLYNCRPFSKPLNYTLSNMIWGSQRWLWRVLYSGIYCRVNDVSEEHRLHLQGRISWARYRRKNRQKVCSAYSTLKMEAIYSPETPVDFQRVTRRCITEDSTLHRVLFSNVLNDIVLTLKLLTRSHCPVLILQSLALVMDGLERIWVEVVVT
jgi:hypothetical protein